MSYVVEGQIRGAGLGLRRSYIGEIAANPPGQVDFYEIAPENWMHLGGSYGKLFRAVSERHTVICHGLSLSLGGPAPLDENFLAALKPFLEAHRVPIYSEHLSYCGDDGLLYDLMPMPFTADAVAYVAERIRRTQEILERRIAIENISYYAAPGQEMTEIDFLNAVLEQADCDLLLDINNIYVNSVNHGYDPMSFLKNIPAQRIAYAHVAGHYQEAPDFLVDTHGAPIVDPVWSLLEQAFRLFGVVPTLLERDFNLPPLQELLSEIDLLRTLQRNAEPALRRYA